MSETKRVYEIARGLGVASSDLLGVLAEAGHAGLTATSNVAVGAAEAAWTADAESRVDARPEGAAAAATPEPGAGGGGPHAIDPPRSAPLRGVAARSPSQAKGAASSEAVGEGEAEARYRLARRGSVTVGAVRVSRGGAVSERVWTTFPARVQAFFDRVSEGSPEADAEA